MAVSIEKLRNKLKPDSCEEGANAAVALIVRLSHGRAHILFVKRAQNPRDLWSGQIALPGGKQDSSDHSMKETVLRETMEEIGIDLLSHGRFLGVMSLFQSNRRPEVSVLPFVVLIDGNLSIKLNRKELEEYMWISVKDLIQNRSITRFELRDFPAYVIGKTVIWGLTYRIVEDLLKNLELG